MRVTPAVRALGLWCLLALVLGAALVLAGHRRVPLDDRDPVHQRTGFLDAVGARSKAPEVTGVLPAPGRVTVVFFVRDAQQTALRSALRRHGALPDNVDAAIVGGRANTAVARVPLITDADHALARRFGMPAPRDGGYPVGYAICGTDGTIRYRTLDPGVAGRLREVRTMIRAVQ
jgi:hypothetical protein